MGEAPSTGGALPTGGEPSQLGTKDRRKPQLEEGWEGRWWRPSAPEEEEEEKEEAEERTGNWVNR